MSFPPAPMAAQAMAAAAPTLINPIEYVIMSLNTNPYFIGLMMLMLNLGGRFLGMEVSKEQEKVFQSPWVRRFLFFTVLFVATRNVVVALIMTIFVLLIVSFLFNENSDLYLWGKPAAAATAVPNKEGFTATSGAPGGLTPEETEILRRLTEKQMRVAASMNTEGEPDEKQRPMSIEEIVQKNLAKLQSP